MARAFVFIVAGAEVTAVIAEEQNNRVVVFAAGLQVIDDTPKVFIQVLAHAVIIRKVLWPVAGAVNQIRRHRCGLEAFGVAIRGDKTRHIVLEVRLQVREK
ncbi:hypothetical protein NGUA11_04176 [Salmonella enterica]|nr:hypothetical protein NGUA11_04176 [Salmonella enterica]